MRQTALVVAVCLFSASLFAADLSGSRRDSVRLLTPEEKQQITRSFMSTLRLKNSQPRTLSNGMVGMELDDSYLNFYMATVTPEGTLEFSCVNTPDGAIAVLTAPAPTIMRLPRAGAAQLPLEEK